MSASPISGREQVGQQPHQEGGEHLGSRGQVGQLQQRDDPAAVGGDAQQLRGFELGFPEEHVTALLGEADEVAQDHPGRGGRDPADLLQLVLAVVGGEELQQRDEVLEVEQRQAIVVGVVEHQPKGAFLHLVEAQHLRQQDRAERRDRRPHRNAGALPAERQELAGRGLRLPRLPLRLDPRGQFLARHPGGGHPGQIPFDVGGEDGHTRLAEGLGHQLEGLGLAGARGPGDEPVPVKHRQRNADGGLDDGGAVHQHTQLHRLAVEPVSGLNRCHQFFTHPPREALIGAIPGQDTPGGMRGRFNAGRFVAATRLTARRFLLYATR